MKTPSLREMIREKMLVERGAIAPARVTEILPDGKGGRTMRAIDPERWREKQASMHAARVASARSRLNLTQVEFATLLGISRRTLENWEQGHRSPAGAARVLIDIAAKHPKVVLEVAAC